MIILAVNGMQSKFGRSRLIETLAMGSSCSDLYTMSAAMCMTSAYITMVTRKLERNEYI